MKFCVVYNVHTIYSPTVDWKYVCLGSSVRWRRCLPLGKGVQGKFQTHNWGFIWPFESWKGLKQIFIFATFMSFRVSVAAMCLCSIISEYVRLYFLRFTAHHHISSSTKMKQFGLITGQGTKFFSLMTCTLGHLTNSYTHSAKDVTIDISCLRERAKKTPSSKTVTHSPLQ